MHRKYKKSCIALVFVILFGLSPSIQIGFGVKPDKPDKPKKPKKKASEISVFVDYKNNGFFPDDYPVVGIPYSVYDGSDMLFASGITDVNGMMNIAIIAGLDLLTGDGIHVEFMWQGALVSINNLMPSETVYNQELQYFVSQIIFTWDGID